ncbi:hypothetical protein SynBIOSU31_01980 [Synechococcus sp. BIOS-U3-1]|nr:hypothetical protein SynBIOSU31_01980 [Synechococcus sp. BIOS-U3-1]
MFIPWPLISLSTDRPCQLISLVASGHQSNDGLIRLGR